VHIHVIMQCEFCANLEGDCNDSCYQKILYGRIFLLGPCPGARKGDAITEADEKARDPNGPVWLKCLKCGTSILNGKSGPDNLLKHQEIHCIKKSRPGAAWDSNTVPTRFDDKGKDYAYGQRKPREGEHYQAVIPPFGESSPIVDTLHPESFSPEEDLQESCEVDVVPTATRKRQRPVMDPEHLNEALKRAVEARLQCVHRLAEIGEELARHEEHGTPP
jgi:hypothetical protein